MMMNEGRGMRGRGMLVFVLKVVMWPGATAHVANPSVARSLASIVGAWCASVLVARSLSRARRRRRGHIG